MLGYKHCECRDCFEIIIDDKLCDDCKQACCEVSAGECKVEYTGDDE